MTGRLSMFDDNESNNGDLAPVEPVIPGLEVLLSDKIRSVDDVLDYASTCALAIANGNVPVKLSKELRLWGELMYTCVQVQSIQEGEGDINFIGQLIQIAGTPGEALLKDALPSEEPKVLDVSEEPLVVNGNG